jgi:3-hydroxyisobutyrate dehydrogenase
MTGPETIAVLGAGGTMGLPMARNLAGAGFAVRAWNRSPEKAEVLAGDGATLCETAAEAAQGAQVIMTMLSDADAVLGVMEGAGKATGSSHEAVWLQMSTIGIDGTRRCERLAERDGLSFVDAPVLGTKQPAEQGALVILASGPADLRERLVPVFEAVGKRTMWVGEAGKGTRLKLALNAWIVALVEGAAETLALAEGLGLDPALVLDAVAGGPLDLPYLQLKGKGMIERRFEPAFSLALAAKDARLVEDAAAEHDLDLPVLAAIGRRLEEGVAEHGHEDLSATFLTSARHRNPSSDSRAHG